MGAAALHKRREDKGISGGLKSRGIQKLPANHHHEEKASLLGMEGSVGSSKKNDGNRRRLLRPPLEVSAGALLGACAHRLWRKEGPTLTTHLRERTLGEKRV